MSTERAAGMAGASVFMTFAAGIPMFAAGAANLTGATRWPLPGSLLGGVDTGPSRRLVPSSILETCAVVRSRAAGATPTPFGPVTCSAWPGSRT